jgi:hypothetical protein
MRRDALPQAVRGLTLRPVTLGADAPIRGAVPPPGSTPTTISGRYSRSNA